MIIAVGTKNPAKIRAVNNSVSLFFPETKIIAVDVSSGISEMPTTEEESLKGAFNRAKEALDKTDADIGIGLEGHTTETKYGMLLLGLVVAMNKNGKYRIGHNGGILLPENIAKRIRKGEILARVMDSISGQKGMNKKDGAIGYFTNGLVTRADSFERGIVYALSSLSNHL